MEYQFLSPPPFSCHFPAGGNPDFLCKNELFVEGHSRAGENPRVLLVRYKKFKIINKIRGIKTLFRQVVLCCRLKKMLFNYYENKVNYVV